VRYRTSIPTAATTYSSLAGDSGKESLPQEKFNMRSGHRFLFGSVFLTAALAMPSAMSYAGPQQDNGHQEEHRSDDNDRNRVYDLDHKDYHNWDENEDHHYRQYLAERHREYHPLIDIKVKEQRTYWNWRHSHPYNDRDGR
jgi:hypothetical protein